EGTGESQTTAAPGEYLFCFWNAENFFDDQDDKRDDVDKVYDEWFAKNPDVFKLKLDHLTRVLMDLTDKRGPDTLALAECEAKERPVELLRDALNSKLKDKSLLYTAFAIKDPKGGRDIATAVLTRLKIVGDKTQILKPKSRILEVHLQAG